MAVYQTTIHMAQSEQGWQEKWFRDGGAQTSLEQLWLDAEAFAVKRASLLGKEAKVKAISVSFESVKFDSVLKYVTMAGDQGQPCGLPDDAVVVRFRAANGLNAKNVFLRGIPDAAIVNGDELNLAGLPAWFGLVGDWANFVIQNGYGWWGQTPGTDGVVIGYTQTVDGFVEINTNANFFAAGDLDKVLNVNLNRVNGRGGSVLNGPLVVRVTDTDTCVTVDRIAVFPFISAGFIHKYSYALRPALFANISRSGSRRPGKPVGQRRGRARERAKG